MNITKRDVLELRRRLKKNECTFSRMCGCYVNGVKEVLLKFGASFLDLEDEEFYKYLEIAKKTLSGTLGNNLLELEFSRGEDAQERQQYLLALKSSKLKNEELLDRLYEQIIEKYQCGGNYLILVFHDIYDVVARTSDRAKLDESEEIYEYMLCAVCPVELSKPGLGYHEDENRIGVRARDWVVGLPELGFVYPAFADHGSDTHAVLYYVKNGKDSHPEFIEGVLGCEVQRTATEEKDAFQTIVQDAFGEEREQADAAFLKIQKNLNEIVAERLEDEGAPPVCVTRETVADVISDVEMPEECKQYIEQGFTQAFGDTPPAAHNLLDEKLLAASAQREHTAALEQQVSTLRERLEAQAAVASPDAAPWDEDGAEAPAAVVVQVPEDKAGEIRAQDVDGRKCLVIPLEAGEAAYINGECKQL